MIIVFWSINLGIFHFASVKFLHSSLNEFKEEQTIRPHLMKHCSDIFQCSIFLWCNQQYITLARFDCCICMHLVSLS
ncbi:unnamed protein product [Brugia timori]|uniref:Secreted protein n=1 Tax=Brugia timori TaxID=42155 RepID=A0A0R3QKB4_9BILA|nr:unnamed protein product [Brugia timori]